ncbi:MAG TPA: helix-turn-helix transcriptional regulator [Streptosporangiaceae bacterium]|jgi:transcriptional regulator with XRE-family HTH domain/tetratricopeptide (TPR) repeat protein
MLSRYTSGDVCNPCLVTDREHPEQAGRVILPLEFWFEPKVREALARWQWDLVLAAIYRETGAAQAQLAYTAGVSQAQISRLIHAKSKTPTIQTVLGIVDGFGVPRLLAGLAPQGLDDLVKRKPAGNGDKTRPGGAVRRREFGKAIVISLIPGVAGGAEPGPVDVTRLDPADVVSDLYALDDRYGGGALADLAERRVRSIADQLGNVSLSPWAETRVHRILGELNACAGWVAHDAGQQARAARLYKDALYFAHVANDKRMRVHVLSNMSMQATHLDRPDEAAHLAEAALSDASGTDPRLHSLLTMRIARAASQRGDRQALQDSRRSAWRLIERASPSTEAPSWFRFFNELELTGLDGICAARIGQHDRAVAAFRQVVDHPGTYARNKAVYTALLTESLARSGQVEESLAVVHGALPLLTQVTSVRMLERLADARDALQSYMDVSGVARCREIMAGLCGH